MCAIDNTTSSLPIQLALFSIHSFTPIDLFLDTFVYTFDANADSVRVRVRAPDITHTECTLLLCCCSGRAQHPLLFSFCINEIDSSSTFFFVLICVFPWLFVPSPSKHLSLLSHFDRPSPHRIFNPDLIHCIPTSEHIHALSLHPDITLLLFLSLLHPWLTKN